MFGRQFIPYTENVAIPPASRQNGRCCKCAIPLAKANRNQMCDVCWSMLEAVASIYWHDIQASWNHENDVRVACKRMMLDSSYGVNNDDPQEA